jgi:glycine/D-amino acid oxidase-like deaminating enzyme
VAQHLVTLGHDVLVIDQERAGYGSTAASTAMLMWEIDVSLGGLTALYGFERAADIYRRSAAAVSGLQSLAESVGAGPIVRPRSSLYLASDTTDGAALLAEHRLRERAGLPGVYLDYRTLRQEFAIDREAALLSPGAADADPLWLAHAMLSAAIARGARIAEAEAIAYESSPTGVLVNTSAGAVIEAGHVVLATGYVMPPFLKPTIHRVSSSWALATPPQERQARWRDGILIWEARENYIYARTTPDGRIIIGGEDDEDHVDPADRNALTDEKVTVLLRKLGALWPPARAEADYRWSGAFSHTVDGLPLIGPVTGHPRLLAAYGYGGNGITFSFMASRMIARLIAGLGEAWFESFAIDRPAPEEQPTPATA